MKRTIKAVMAIIAAAATMYGTAWAVGFHGGGGGFGGGFGGGGFHGGEFGGGGFGGGGFGGGGGYHPQSFGGGGFSGGGGGFDHAGVPSFSGAGSRGDGFSGGFGGMSFGGDHAGGFGELGGGGAASRPSLSAFGGFDSAGRAGTYGGDHAFGQGGAGDFGGHVTASQINSFLGMHGSPASSGFTDNTFARGFAGNHPSWQNMQPSALANANERIQNGLRPGSDNASKLSNWQKDNPDRAKQLSDWGNQVRDHWNDHNHAIGGDWWSQQHPAVDNRVDNRINNGVRPGSDWWSKYHPNLDHWYYHHDWHNHPWWYWWGVPTWGALGTWFPWSWSQPLYYDYGPGGNVIYQNNDVYVNGQDVGTAEDYAQSAADLATVPAQDTANTNAGAADANQNGAANQEQWMPLGTFGVLTSKQQTEPTSVLQLAVDKQGILSGTMHNSSTDKSYVVQGRVDKTTQRVAMTFGDKSDVVMETGIYNLTQQETPVLMHFGSTKTETYYLVRLKAPGGATDQGGGATGNTTPPADSPSAQ